MTTVWKITQLWPGKTVAVLAGGPSLTQKLADSVRKHKRIVVNYAYRFALDADMAIALDSAPEFFAELDAAGFTGMKLCGGAVDLPGVHYIGQRFERIVFSPNHIIETRNTGLTAIRLAAELGARRILLLGFDPETPGHWPNYPTDETMPDKYWQELADSLAVIIAELRAQGIEVERIK